MMPAFSPAVANWSMSGDKILEQISSRRKGLFELMVAVCGPTGSIAFFRAVARQEHCGGKTQWRETTPVKASRKWGFWKGPETSYSLQRHTLSGPLPPRKTHRLISTTSQRCTLGYQFTGGINALVNVSILMIQLLCQSLPLGVALSPHEGFSLGRGERVRPKP